MKDEFSRLCANCVSYCELIVLGIKELLICLVYGNARPTPPATVTRTPGQCTAPHFSQSENWALLHFAMCKCPLKSFGTNKRMKAEG